MQLPPVAVLVGCAGLVVACSSSPPGGGAPPDPPPGAADGPGGTGGAPATPPGPRERPDARPGAPEPGSPSRDAGAWGAPDAAGAPQARDAAGGAPDGRPSPAPGVDGGAPDRGSSAPPAAGCRGAGATFCADFEAEALPAGLVFQPAYARPRMADFVTVDATVARSGRRSVRIRGTDFSQMLAVAAPAPAFWARVYMRSDLDTQDNHNTFFLASVGDGSVNTVDAQVKIAENKRQLAVTRNPPGDEQHLSNGDDWNNLTNGVKLEANTWHCVEAFFNGPASELRVFVGGQEIPTLHVTDWGPYQWKTFKFGYEKYGGPKAKTMWYDDVAVGTQRIGCE